MKVLIVGLGQVGSATAWAYQKAGWTVQGYDINPKVCALRAAGVFPHGDDFGDLRIECPTHISDDYDAVAICVPTPAPDKHDISMVQKAVETFGWCGRCVIIRSTMPVGGCRQLNRRTLLYVPEIRPVGKMVVEWPLSIIGVPDPAIVNVSAAMPLVNDSRPFVFNLEEAEFAKLAINAYLASSITIANALESAAYDLGVDYSMIERVLRQEPRIGKGAFVQAGLGFGGSCLPKDLRGLCEQLPRSFLSDIDDENERIPEIVERIEKLLGGSLEGKRICVLGLTFKPGSDCLTDSKAVALVDVLMDRAQGNVFVDDPYVAAHGGFKPEQFDLFILACPHPEYFDLWNSLPEEKKFCPISNPWGIV